MFNLTEGDASLKKFADDNIYFEGLHSLGELSDDVQGMLCEQARPGAIVWNTDIDADKIFVKCKN